MVAKITVPSSIRRALNYNEQKVKVGKAVCLHASGFLKEANALHFAEKLSRFEALISLNKRASTNTVHASLNFAAGEVITDRKMEEIATGYMERIGFRDQPFLVYKHLDAGHPHLHIVTTNIRRDGSRISLHNLGKDASEKARKKLERQFGLVNAEGRKKEKTPLTHSPFTQKVIYGKSTTIRAITNVLDAVLLQYRYASLPELNAVLKRYNVIADRGAAAGVMYHNRGLVYRILDDSGKKVGVPVKASLIYSKPTLSFLEQQFKENAGQKEKHKNELKAVIDWILLKPPKNLASFEKGLQNENISLIVRQNEQNFVYGLTYVDHRTKCVYNGSELGKGYSAKGVLERCGISQKPTAEKTVEETSSHHQTIGQSTEEETAWNKEAALAILERLLQPEQQNNSVPYEQRPHKKKRRKI